MSVPEQAFALSVAQPVPAWSRPPGRRRRRSRRGSSRGSWWCWRRRGRPAYCCPIRRRRPSRRSGRTRSARCRKGCCRSCRRRSGSEPLQLSSLGQLKRGRGRQAPLRVVGAGTRLPELSQSVPGAGAAGRCCRSRAKTGRRRAAGDAGAARGGRPGGAAVGAVHAALRAPARAAVAAEAYRRWCRRAVPRRSAHPWRRPRRPCVRRSLQRPNRRRGNSVSPLPALACFDRRRCHRSRVGAAAGDAAAACAGSVGAAASMLPPVPVPLLPATPLPPVPVPLVPASLPPPVPLNPATLLPPVPAPCRPCRLQRRRRCQVAGVARAAARSTAGGAAAASDADDQSQRQERDRTRRYQSKANSVTAKPPRVEAKTLADVRGSSVACQRLSRPGRAWRQAA